MKLILFSTLLASTLADGRCVGRCEERVPILFDGISPQQYMMQGMLTAFEKLETQQKINSDANLDIVDGKVECVNGFAGEYPCKNVDLMSYISHKTMKVLPTSGLYGNDIWGWVDPSNQKEYAIVCQADGTTFVDVSNPLLPIILGRLKTHTRSSSWRDAKVFNNYAFIVAEATGHGVQLFDLTQLRNVSTPGASNLFSETGYFGATGRCHNIVINEASATAFCVGSANVCRGGLYMIDISDPKNMKNSGCYAEDGYTHDAQCVIYNGPDTFYKGKEICFALNEDSLTIVDITTRLNPILISRSKYSGSAYTHQGWLLEDHTHLFVDDELDEQRNTASSAGRTVTYVWDVSSLERPVQTMKHLSPTTSIDHNQYVKDGKSYQSNYASGLRIVDVSRVKEGVTSEWGFFDVRPEDDVVDFFGSWSNYPYFPSGNVIVNSIERGLFVVRPRL